MGDFNVAFREAKITAFCNEYKLKTLNKEPTCSLYRLELDNFSKNF